MLAYSLPRLSQQPTRCDREGGTYDRPTSTNFCENTLGRPAWSKVGPPNSGANRRSQGFQVSRIVYLLSWKTRLTPTNLIGRDKPRTFRVCRRIVYKLDRIIYKREYLKHFKIAPSTSSSSSSFEASAMTAHVFSLKSSFVICFYSSAWWAGIQEGELFIVKCTHSLRVFRAPLRWLFTNRGYSIPWHETRPRELPTRRVKLTNELLPLERK